MAFKKKQKAHRRKLGRKQRIRKKFNVFEKFHFKKIFTAENGLNL